MVATGKNKYSLLADGMNNSEEIVVKPLARHIKGTNRHYPDFFKAKGVA